MAILPISLVTAAALSLLVLVLSINVILHRRRVGQPIDSGSDKPLAYAIRAHANLVEYAPFVMVLFVVCELAGTSAIWLAFNAVLLLIGRLVHAYSMLLAEAKFKTYIFRQIGMGATFLTILLLGITAFWQAAANL